MVFSSVIFLFMFLPLVLLGYFLMPRRFRNPFLLCASMLFYAWGEVRFLAVMLASCLIDFTAGWVIEREFDKRGGDPAAPRPKTRTRTQRLALILSIAANLALLIFFKYSHFAVDNYNLFMESLGFTQATINFAMQIALPLGISFYTFQSMSYTIDVYRGNVRATRSLVDFATFVTLFPQLIAGPIVRYRDIMDQLVSRRVTLAGFAEGVKLFIIGLGKKVLIANILAEPADRIFALPYTELPWDVAWIGAICFPLQLYFDFSGYSDMAVGMGRMFGFSFPGNFNYPFLTRCAPEFWTRWHITLSSWLRDYIFTPLGGYRCGRGRAMFNILVTFFLCGLWHGASWNFVLFGLIPGIWIIAERLFSVNRRWFYKTPLMHLYTKSMILVCMILFRTETLPDAGHYLLAMLGLAAAPSAAIKAGFYLNPEVLTALAAGLIGSVPFAPWLKSCFAAWGDRQRAAGGYAWAELVRQAGQLVFLAAVLMACAMKLAAGTHNPFIYFRF